MGIIDLHVHTSCSDGSFSPKKVVEEAKKAGLKAIAITDHDTIEGIDEALNSGKELGVEVVPGVEITCDEEKFEDIHIIGLLIDHKYEKLNELLAKAKQARLSQKQGIIKKLNELGFDITLDDIFKIAKGEISRSHIAEVLLKKYPDKFQGKKQVFDEYIDVNRKAYVQREVKIDLKAAIDAITNAGGIAVLAHPEVYNYLDIEKLIKRFKALGGQAIETEYTYDKNRPFKCTDKEMVKKIIDKYKNLAKKLNLLETGGSDYHGDKKDVEIGEAKTEESLLNILKAHKPR